MADMDEDVASWRKSSMPPRSTRQEARARILATFQAQLDRMIPEDEEVPLKQAGFTYSDRAAMTRRNALVSPI